MKKVFLLFGLFVMVASSAMAQRFAYIDTKYILDKLPEYTKAQSLLDNQAAQWQKEIDTKSEQLDKMYSKYDAESFLLTNDLKKQREDEIIKAENEIQDLSPIFSPGLTHSSLKNLRILSISFMSFDGYC